jgi:hypothetical protein
LDYGIIETFTDCHFLEHLPKFDQKEESILADDIYDKYFGLTNPIFELLLSITSRYEPGTKSITLKVINSLQKLSNFFIKHYGIIIALLRKGCEQITLLSLYQLKLITAIFAWLGSNHEFISKSVFLH